MESSSLSIFFKNNKTTIYTVGAIFATIHIIHHMKEFHIKMIKKKKKKQQQQQQQQLSSKDNEKDEEEEEEDGMPKLPKGVVKYSQIPIDRNKTFTLNTIPRGLLNRHTTKIGTWGVIRIIKGSLEYKIAPRGNTMRKE
jgi:thiamine pyrophosphate-dependent acetolactate synthase large subunit-like protein